jgi:hypothetical protein
MKRADFYRIREGIKNIGHLFSDKDYEFVYRAVCIDEIAEAEIAKYEKTRVKPSEEYNKLIEEQSKLVDECAQKNEDGSFIMVSKMEVKIAKPDAFTDGMKSLKEKYKTAIDKHDAEEKKFNEFLEKEAPGVKFELIPKKYLPKGITINQMKGIFLIIEK